MGRKKKVKSTPRKIKIMRRQTQAFELRLAGATFQQIADQMNYKSRQAAYNAYSAGLNMIVKQPAEESLQVHRERLNRLFLAYYPQAKKGLIGAGNMCIKVLQEISKIEGHYAPERFEFDATTEFRRMMVQLGLTDDDIRSDPLIHSLFTAAGVEISGYAPDGTTSGEEEE